MTDPSPDPVPPDAAAAMEANAEELTCPVCEYSLRGLPEPRCPECGYVFEWEELRVRTRLRRAWFYEHAETFKSHLKTRWRSLWPRGFWSQIAAYTEANPKRLLRYQLTTLLLVLLACAPFVLPVVGGYLDTVLPRGKTVFATTLPSSGTFTVLNGGRSVGGSPYTWPQRPGTSGQSATGAVPMQVAPTYYYYVPAPWWAETLRGLVPGRRLRSGVPLATVAVGFCVLLPVLLGLYWQLLRVSVLRAAVKPVHLTRVNAYTTDVLPLLLFLTALTVVSPDAFEVAFFILPLPVVLLMTWRMTSALRRYLRFPHALPVALAFGVMVGLLWVVVAINAALSWSR